MNLLNKKKLCRLYRNELKIFVQSFLIETTTKNISVSRAHKTISQTMKKFRLMNKTSFCVLSAQRIATLGIVLCVDLEAISCHTSSPPHVSYYRQGRHRNDRPKMMMKFNNKETFVSKIYKNRNNIFAGRVRFHQ